MRPIYSRDSATSEGIRESKLRSENRKQSRSPERSRSPHSSKRLAISDLVTVATGHSNELLLDAYMK